MGAHILGDFRQQKIGHPQSYFEQRDCWVDCRTPGMLEIDKEANIGWCVNFITLSHNVDPGMFGQTVARKIKIGKHAFIAAFATLYNCEIGEGAVVACGTVVRSQDVRPWTMVAGNPAKVIAEYDHTAKRWAYL